MDVAKGLAERLNTVMKEFKEIGTLHVSAGYSEASVHLFKDGLKKLGLELKFRFRGEEYEHPYEVYSEVDGVRFFSIVTKAELEEHFPHLLEEAQTNEK